MITLTPKEIEAKAIEYCSQFVSAKFNRWELSFFDNGCVLLLIYFIKDNKECFRAIELRDEIRDGRCCINKIELTEKEVT